MANTKAAKKANKQNEARRSDNKAKLSRIKTERKKFLEAVVHSSSHTVSSAFVTCQSLLAKAAKKGLIHWKKAARLVSRMAAKMKKD